MVRLLLKERGRKLRGVAGFAVILAMLTMLPLAIFSMGLAVSIAIIAAALQAYLLLGQSE